MAVRRSLDISILRVAPTGEPCRAETEERQRKNEVEEREHRWDRLPD
jgi:hypothetical protein